MHYLKFIFNFAAGFCALPYLCGGLERSDSPAACRAAARTLRSLSRACWCAAGRCVVNLTGLGECFQHWKNTADCDYEMQRGIRQLVVFEGDKVNESAPPPQPSNSQPPTSPTLLGLQLYALHHMLLSSLAGIMPSLLLIKAVYCLGSESMLGAL